MQGVEMDRGAFLAVAEKLFVKSIADGTVRNKADIQDFLESLQLNGDSDFENHLQDILQTENADNADDSSSSRALPQKGKQSRAQPQTKQHLRKQSLKRKQEAALGKQKKLARHDTKQPSHTMVTRSRTKRKSSRNMSLEAQPQKKSKSSKGANNQELKQTTKKKSPVRAAPTHKMSLRTRKQPQQQPKHKPKVPGTSHLADPPPQPGTSRLSDPQPQSDPHPHPGTSGVTEPQAQADSQPQPGTSGLTDPQTHTGTGGTVESFSEGDLSLDSIEENLDVQRQNTYPFNYDSDKVTHGNRSFSLKLVHQRRYKKYIAVDSTFHVKFHEEWMGESLVSILDNLYNLFDQLIIRATRRTPKAPEGRFIRIIIRHGSIKSPIVVPFMDLERIDPGIVLERIQATLNSNETLAIDNSFSVVVGTVRVIKGKARLYPTSNINLQKKRSIINITNDDNLCLQRAIAVAWIHQIQVPTDEWDKVKAKFPFGTPNIKIIARYKKCNNSYYKDVLKPTRNEQWKVADLLARAAGVPMDRPGEMSDIPKYEKVLNMYISVVSREHGNKFVTPPKTGKKDTLYLYHNYNHFDTILTPTGFFNAAHFCNDCQQPFSDFKNHVCHTCCRVCHSTKCNVTSYIDCKSCNMTCRSLECYKRHKAVITEKRLKKKTSLCSLFWKCLDCKRVLRADKRSQKDHFCSERICSSCKEYVHPDHRCYMMATPIKTIPLKLCVFDFETRQEDELECTMGYAPKNMTGEGCTSCEDSESRCDDCTICLNCHETKCGAHKHTPNLVISQTVCDLCSHILDTDYTTKCPGCGSRCSKCDKFSKNPDGSIEFKYNPCTDTCGHRVKVFSGDNCAANFGDWIFQDYHKDMIAASHYGKGFDNIFILSYLLDNGIPPESVIYSGSKIMAMSVGRGMNIRFIDTYNFFQLALSALPAAFGFTHLTKGFFCHMFNTKKNQNYIGPYPDAKYYGHEYMSSTTKAEFDKWHKERRENGDVFDFKKEIVDYCKMDTDILLKAVIHYRQIIMSICGIDPYIYYTLPSLCMGIFKSCFLEEEWEADILNSYGNVMHKGKTVKYKGGIYREGGDIIQEGCVKKKKFLRSKIAHIPAVGYTTRDQYSLESICYLEWLSKERGVEIQHALNRGEKKIKVGRSWYRADGFIPDQTGKTPGTVIEYHGCSHHGCTSCFESNRDITKLAHTGCTITERYQATKRKENDLRLLGYTYECFWACQYKKKLKEDPQFNSFVTNLIKSKDLTERLDIREAMLGGRVDCTKLYYDVAEDESIHYFDVTSLYPYVNKYKEYPVGHPEIITSDFKSIDNYFGLVKCRVLPPTDLYHPVLPMKSNGKLKFPLCATCAREEYKFYCQCTDSEREMTGVWTTLELKKALEKGYKITKVHEVYHWTETTTYNPDTNEPGLFSEYVNTFLKLKQQAAGWPSNCVDNEENQDKYLQDYYNHEHIQLDKEKIKDEKNPSMYTSSKFALCSLWGKFAQRLNLKQTRFFTDKECDLFFQTLLDPSKDISNFHIISDNVIQLEYANKDEFVPESVSANVFLGIFTTSHARLQLYEILDFLDNGVTSTTPPPTAGPLPQSVPSKHTSYPTRVLYYDTDSVIFTTKKDQPNPPLGNFLGDLTDECPTEKIVKFISAGPKVYAYRTESGKEVCKIRGFTLNYANKKIINMDNLEKIIVNWNDHVAPLVTKNENNLIRDKPTCNILTVPQEKKFKMVYTKRIIKSDFDTVPYGYRGV